MLDTILSFVPLITALAAVERSLAGDAWGGINSAALAVLFFMVRDVRARVIRVESIHLPPAGSEAPTEHSSKFHGKGAGK